MTLPNTGSDMVPARAPMMDAAASAKKSKGVNAGHSSSEDTKTPKPIKSESSTVSPEDGGDVTALNQPESSVDALAKSTTEQESPQAKSESSVNNAMSGVADTHDSAKQTNDASPKVQEDNTEISPPPATNESPTDAKQEALPQKPDNDEKPVKNETENVTAKSPESQGKSILEENAALERGGTKMEEVEASTPPAENTKAETCNGGEPKSFATTSSDKNETNSDDKTKTKTEEAMGDVKMEEVATSPPVDNSKSEINDCGETKSSLTINNNNNKEEASCDDKKEAASDDTTETKTEEDTSDVKMEEAGMPTPMENTKAETCGGGEPKSSTDISREKKEAFSDVKTKTEEDRSDVKMEEVATSPPVDDTKIKSSTTISDDNKETANDDTMAVETKTEEKPQSRNSSDPTKPESQTGDVEMKDSTFKVEEEAVEQDESKQVDVDKKDESMKEEDDVEEEEEEEVEPASLSELREILDDIDTPGSTCAAGPATCLPAIPGLCVDGVGDVALPISDAQAKALASVAEQAPHGKGMETIVDKSVRNTLQVDPSKVTIQNPAWETSLRKLVQQAAESLGVSPSLVRAELYKLLLYEEGGFFKKHRDTEKAQGMFATLVVQLPSKFTGGSFVVSHGGESETFSLGGGNEAAYGCHFVCHYADCEHEIKKVESGHRLALIYSLCYTGAGKPSANDVGHNSLSSTLKRLPPDETLFVIPLEHQYTTASLARLGAGALKGFDRAKQSAIENAGKGAWKTIVARAERTDSESGDGSYYGGFDVYDVQRGSVDLSDAYNADGSDASIQLRWIEKQVDFESTDEGGMMMVSAEDLEDDDGAAVWGDGDSGSVEYTGNEGATRETTYSTYVLVAYSEQTAFERLCASEFSSAVSHVIEQESVDLMRRILSYMKDKKVSISNNDCVRLLQATSTVRLPEDESLLAFEIIVGALASNKEMPSVELTNALIASVERFGWTCAADPIKAMSAKLLTRKDLTTINFLKQVDFLFRMQQASNCTDFDGIIDESTRDFDSRTKNPPATSGGYRGYSYNYSYNSQYNSSPQATADALVSLSQRHPREKTKPVVQVCVTRMRKQEGTGIDKLAQRASLLQRLSQSQESSDISRWFQGVVEDFVAIVEKLPRATTPSTRYGGSVDLLSSNHAVELFRRLFEFGKSNDIQKVQHWAMNAQLDPLCKLEKILGRVTSATVATTSGDSVAVNSFVQSVQARIKTLKLSSLVGRHQKLIAATQRGQPVFSWSMPRASTSNPSLTAFLRSERTGPETIIVGGGINNARSLTGSSRGSYRYGRYSSSSRSSDPVKQGYSATIEATNATGRNAAIRVTKTRALHDALMKKYREDVSELTKTAEEIRKLGGSAAVPTTTAAGAHAVINIDDTSSQPKKKRRVKAPIPSNAEIVEIE